MPRTHIISSLVATARWLSSDAATTKKTQCHFDHREKSACSFFVGRKADFSPDEAGFEMTGNEESRECDYGARIARGIFDKTQARINNTNTSTGAAFQPFMRHEPRRMAIYTICTSAAIPTTPSNRHRPNARIADLRGSPKPPATGRAAYRRPQTL